MRMIGVILQAAVIAAVTLGAFWLLARAPAPACRVAYVYDGDTIAMDCGAGEVTARIAGLNAPETREAQCDAERAAGARATARLRELVRGQTRIALLGKEKYGRDLIALFVDGQDAAAILIREGLAEPYSGGRRRDWCAP